MVGRTISHYQVLEKLGSGGMGEIFKAQDSRLARMVAIKVLSRRAATDEERRRRFIKEAQAASSLNHPNIITIYDILSDEENEYMVMEFVPGRTLSDITAKGGVDISKALQYAVQISDALASAHAAGIVHRDLKPGNIMVTESGRIKILDFGLAKMTVATQISEDTETIGGAPMTVEGSIIGTVNYMSPEQAEGKRVDARSDIFSFGVVLYELITGTKAFARDSAVSTLTAILRDPVRPLSDHVTGVPPELEEIVGRALRKDPAQRWQSMQQVHSMLVALRQKYESGVLYAMPIPSSKKKRRLALATAALGITVAVGAGVMVSRRNQPQRPPATPPANPPTARVEAPAPAIATPLAPTPAPAPKKAEKAAPTSAIKPPVKADNVLTNQSIIDMVEAKVSPSLMVSLIRSSKTKFDFSVPEIIRMTKAGVPEQVIEVMRDPAAPPKPATPEPAAGPPPPTPTPGPREHVLELLGRGFNPGGPGKGVVYGGLPLMLTLLDDIPRDPQEGMPLRFRVEQDLKLGPSPFVAKGAVVTGEIVYMKTSSGRSPRPGFKLSTVQAADGTKLKVRASPGRNSQRNEQPVEVPGYTYKESLAPAGTRYMGYIDGDQPVGIKK